jgi:hypothetical protein
MVLRETLVDTDIPHRDKMRETVVIQWRNWFEQLKSDLSVSIGIFFFLSAFNRRRNPAGESVSLQTPGQTRR